MSAPAVKSSSSKGGSPSKFMDPARWINPCGIPGHIFDPERDMNGAPEMDIKENYRNIIEAATAAKNNAVDVKKQFLNSQFPGSDFEETGDVYSQQWLPTIPKATEENFRGMNRSAAYRKSFEYLQYFAVGIEQIMLDQTLHSGEFIEQFKQVEDYLTQILCQLQMGMFVLKVQPNGDVLRDVMSHEYRDITERTSRNLRDYLILRDYIKSTKYIRQLFAYMLSKMPE